MGLATNILIGSVALIAGALRGFGFNGRAGASRFGPYKGGGNRGGYTRSNRKKEARAPHMWRAARSYYRRYKTVTWSGGLLNKSQRKRLNRGDMSVINGRTA